MDNLRRIKFEKTFSHLPGFLDLLEREKPDIVHFHDQNGGASLSHLRKSRSWASPRSSHITVQGKPVPRANCCEMGRFPATERSLAGAAPNCRLQYAGLPKQIASLISLVEWPGVSWRKQDRIFSCSFCSHMTRKFAESLTNLSPWRMALLSWRNGVLMSGHAMGAPMEKIHFISTGGREAWAGVVPSRLSNRREQVLRLACLGRCSEIKGFQILIDAVKDCLGRHL